MDYRTESNAYWSNAEASGLAYEETASLATQIELVAGIGTALDIGSGRGELVQALCSKGLDARGLDISDVAVMAANEICPDRFARGSVLAIPQDDRSVDIVTCINLLEHLSEDDVWQALTEVARIARRTVYLRVSTQTKDRERPQRTVRNREWWEKRAFETGLRRHPCYFQANSYEGLETEGGDIVILLEPMPLSAAKRFPLSTLRKERDLHMDMAREAGRRSDAHIMRYHEAARHVRPGDRVLDAACGLGYGAHLLRHNSLCASVLGMDVSKFAIEYARSNYEEDGRVSFEKADLPKGLEKIESGSVDFIASFETLEHLADPLEFLEECRRILSPGGRIMLSVPNDWTEEDGKDPNPHHLQVYDWNLLIAQVSKFFLVEKAFSQTASRRKRDGAWVEHGREWRETPLDRCDATEAEWSLLLAMKDPVGAQEPFVDRINDVEGLTKVPEVIDFANQYKNPWLVPSLIAIGLRTENAAVRADIAARVSETETGADAAAALCIEGYQLLSEQCPASSIIRWRDSISDYSSERDWSIARPIDVRWGISLLFISALLKKKSGDFTGYIEDLNHLIKIDFLRYSPLLGTKVVEANYQLGMWHWLSGEVPRARAHFLAGMEAARAAVSANWDEAFGPNDQQPRFVTGELAEILDLATKCALGLKHASHERPTGRVALEVRWNKAYEHQNSTSLTSVYRRTIDKLLATKSQWYEPELDRREAEIARLSAIAAQQDELQASLTSALSERDALAARIEGELASTIALLEARAVEAEAEIARLRSHVEHAKFEKETQLLRRRMMYHAENDRRLGDQIAELRSRLGEEAKLRETWYVPELARLHADIAQMTKTKAEWFEPQLEHRVARIAQLEAEVERLYRQAQNVLPVRLMRATIREARRIAGAVRRRLKR